MSSLAPLSPIFIALGVVLFVVDVVVSRAVLRDSGLSTSQRIAQFVFIWLVPYVGAIVTYFVIAYHHTKEQMKQLFPFPLYLIYREPIAPGGYGDVGPIGEGSCGGDGD